MLKAIKRIAFIFCLFLTILAPAGWRGMLVYADAACSKPSFRAGTITYLDGGYGAFAYTDFNGDGRLDIAISNAHSFLNYVSIFLDDGTGSFGPSTDIPVEYGPGSIVTRDFNSDGKLDLAVAHSEDIFSILFGDGAGNFSAPTQINVVGTHYSLAAGDFNGDGHPDLVTTNYYHGTVTVLLGDGMGGFSGRANYPLNGDPYDVIVEDFNHDGKEDLAVANYTSTVSILLNRGDGRFRAKVNYPVGMSVVALATADFNNDGNPDIASVNFNSSDISILTGDGTGRFTVTANFATTGFNPAAIAVGDFNGDGNPDLVFSNGEAGTISLLLNDGAGGFAPPREIFIGSSPGYIEVDDFNRDGRADLTVAHGAKILRLLGDGKGNFAVATAVAAGSYHTSIATADFNGDQKPDLATTNFNANTISIVSGNGMGGFGPPLTFPAGSDPVYLTVGDFNADMRPDLAVANNTESGSVSILLSNGPNSFGSPLSYPVGSYPQAIAVGDYNGDQKPDLAVANSYVDSISILLNDGTGGFAAATTLPTGEFSDPRHLATGDFNNDQKADLAVAKWGPGKVSILLGDGMGGFGTPTDLDVGVSPIFIVVKDFNNDGNSDLAVADNFFDGVIIVLGNGMGGFPSQSSYDLHGSMLSLGVDDFNGDGFFDVAVANETTDDLSVLLGDGAGLLQTPVNYNIGLKEIPNSVATADFNGDGKPDIALSSSPQEGAPSGKLPILFNTCGPAAPPIPYLSIDDVTVREGSPGMLDAMFTVSLSAASAQTVAVKFATQPATAASGVDYVAKTGTLVFNPGQTTRTITVLIKDDQRDELDETFFVKLTNPTNVSIVDNRGVAIITDDDPVPGLSVSDVSVREGNAGTTNASFTVTLSVASGKPVTVDFQTTNGSALATRDYNAISGSLTFAPGEVKKVLKVEIIGDTRDEANERFFVNLRNSTNATISKNRGEGTIIDNDTPPTLSMNNMSLTENNSEIVNRSQ